MVTTGDSKANIVVALESCQQLVLVNGWLVALTTKGTFLAESYGGCPVNLIKLSVNIQIAPVLAIKRYSRLSVPYNSPEALSNAQAEKEVQRELLIGPK